MLASMRPVAVLVGHLQRVEVDAKGSRWRKQIYKQVMDRDTDMLIWRHRAIIGKLLIGAIYSKPLPDDEMQYTRIQDVWAWWWLDPKLSRA